MNDDDLRQLFDDATSQIRPQGTLDDIRNRTEKVDPMARRWFLPSLIAAAVMVALIGGAFYFTRDTGASTATPAGSSNDSPTTTATSVDASTADAVVYYVGDGARGPRLFSENDKVVTTYHPAPVAAVNQAMNGTPGDADYKTYWPAGVSAVAVSQSDGGSIEIGLTNSQDVLSRPAGVTARQATAQVEAIVRTARAAMAMPDAQVSFTADSSTLTQVLGVAGPTFTGGTDDDALALVSISSPTNNAKVAAGKLTVTGVASAFEGTVTWEILVGGDAVVDSGHATAQECCTLSPYSFQTNIALAPGTYTLVVHDSDESGAGGPVNRDSKEIIVE